MTQGVGVDLVVFDCDGVLVDSERLSVEVDQRVLAQLGWDLTTAEIIHRFVGRSSAHFRAEVESHLGRRLPDDWETPFQSWYIDAFESDLRPVEGIVTALEEIEVEVCVASSGSHEKIRRSLGLTGILPRFEGRIYSADDVEHGKPAPDLFLFAASSLGVSPARCVVVEDSRFGAAAGRDAGMRVLGYAGGLTPADWLAAEGAVVFTDMADLPTLLRATAQGGSLRRG